MTQYVDMAWASEIIKHLSRTNDGGIAILNSGQLESALDKPRTVLFGHEQYPELYQKVAILMETLTKAHCLSDGNKRFAMLAAEIMAYRNGATLVHPLKSIRFSVDTAMDAEDAMRDEIQLWFKTHLARDDTELAIMLEERLGEEYAIYKLVSEGKIEDAKSLIGKWMAFDSYPEYKKELEYLVGRWEIERKYEYGWKSVMDNVFDSHIENPALYESLIKISKKQDLKLVGHTIEELAVREKNITKLAKRIDGADNPEYKHQRIDVLMGFRRYEQAQRCCQKMLQEHPQDPYAPTKLALIYYGARQYIKCINFVKKSLNKSTPARAVLRYLEAQSQVGLNNLDGATKICDEEIKKGNKLKFAQLKCFIEKQKVINAIDKKLEYDIEQSIPLPSLLPLMNPNTPQDVDTILRAVPKLRDRQLLVDIIRTYHTMERHNEANALRRHLRRSMFG